MRSAHASSPIGGGPRVHSRLKGALSLAIASAALVPLAAGCQSGGLGSGHASGATSLTVAAIKGVDTAPLFLAVKDGAFARAGLDVKIRAYPSVAQELQALSKGSVDVAAGDYVDFFSVIAKSGHPYLSIIADGYHASPGVMEVLTYPGSGISTPGDLAGRTIGTPEPEGFSANTTKKVPYNLETLATQSALKNDGVDLTRIAWQPMPEADLITALASHKVAAILVGEPYIFRAESKLGAVAVLDSCTGATANLPLSGYFALSASVHEHRLTYRTFQHVLERAQSSAVLQGPIRAELSTVRGMSMESASLVTIGTYPTTLNAAGIQRVADLMFALNMLSHKKPNVRGLIPR